MCVCVCACACARERERERGGEKGSWVKKKFSSSCTSTRIYMYNIIFPIGSVGSGTQAPASGACKKVTSTGQKKGLFT